MSDLATAFCYLGGVIFAMVIVALALPWIVKFISWYFDWVMDK